MSMKYAVVGCLFLIASMSSYADDECSNSNPYLQQTCENLKQSAVETQKTRDEESKKEIARREILQRKNIEEENKPPEKPQPKIPEWQKSLKPSAPIHAQQQHKSGEKTEADEDTTSSTPPPSIKPLPTLEPTEFANPKSVTLPGGLNVIPIKPDKSSNKGAIKYY